jgi:CMP-N,N'-diacetyllegionaminic acid synthase
MTSKLRVTGVIPARRDSVGIPGKNIRDFSGQPLVSWSIKAAIESRFIDRVVVTSNDSKVQEIVKSEFPEVDFLQRPEELATNESSMISVILDCTKNFESDEILVLLQPTSPLRTYQDIDSAIELFYSSNCDSCISVSEPTHSPLWNFLMSDSGFLSPLVDFNADLPRQALPRYFALNGAVYITSVGFMRENKRLWGGKVIGYEMPYHRSVDIDSEIDFKIAELLNEQFN